MITAENKPDAFLAVRQLLFYSGWNVLGLQSS